MPHSPCSSAVEGSASRRFVPPPSAAAALGRCVAVPVDAPVPESSHPLSWPISPICRRRLHRPRSPGAWGTVPSVGPAPAGRRPGPVYWRDAPPQPAAVPGCPPRCAACARLPVCQRRNLWAPFFCSLHRLAVNDGSAGTGLATLSLSQCGVQGVVPPLPGSVPAPSAEVVEDDAPGREVVGQHPPRTPGAQYVADGVDDLLTGILDRSPTRLGWRQQRFQQLPLPRAEVAGITCSFHTPTLPATPRFKPSCHHPNFNLFRHPLTACMRKLLTIPNSMLKYGSSWNHPATRSLTQSH